MRSLFLSLLGAGILSGCSHYPLEKPVRRPVPIPSIYREHGYVEQTKFELQQTPIRERSRYTVKDISFMSEGLRGREVSFRYYDIRGKRKTPAIVILPILGGGRYDAEEHVARYYARHGFSSVILHRKHLSKEVRDILNLDGVLRESIVDSRNVVDWLCAQEDIDSSCLGLFGISFGGIKASMLLPLEERFKGAVLALVGGDLAYIVAHTTEPGLAERRDQLLKKNKMSLADGEERLRKYVLYEPLKLAPSVEARKVLMVLLRGDTVVPYKKGIELRKALGHPEMLEVHGDHYSKWALVYVPWVRRETLDFFRKRFAEEGTSRVVPGSGARGARER